MNQNFVKVSIKCTSMRRSLDFCVRVDRGVPDQLRCQPSGGSGASGPSGVCPDCEILLQPGRLATRVNQLVSRGWSEYVREGSVVIAC